MQCSFSSSLSVVPLAPLGVSFLTHLKFRTARRGAYATIAAFPARSLFKRRLHEHYTSRASGPGDLEVVPIVLQREPSQNCRGYAYIEIYTPIIRGETKADSRIAEEQTSRVHGKS